jgi:phenylacetate-CoA ligase
MKEPRNQDVGFFDKVLETMSWEQKRENLNTRFVELFRRAYRHSKTYEKRFREWGIELPDVRGLEDLEKLPLFSTKDLVEWQKEHWPFGGIETIDPKEFHRIYINAGVIFQPGATWEFEDTSWPEALCAAGFRRGDRIVNTFSYHLWPFAFMLDEGARRIGATVIPTGVGNTMMQVRILQMLEVNGFMGTPGFLMTLMQRAEAMGMNLEKDIYLDAALVSAEMLPESLRSRLEQKLRMTIRQAYGTVLLGCIGYECREMSGLHVPHNMLVEVVDPQTGKQVPDGVAGEIVATNFNLSYPMIRMATGDLSTLIMEPCPCGRTGPKLKKIIGRIDQAVKIKGTFVHPWQADEVMSRYPEVFKYQVVVTREDHSDEMTFVVELKEETTRAPVLKGRMERDIKDILTLKGIVQIVPRGTIPDQHRKIEDRRRWD